MRDVYAMTEYGRMRPSKSGRALGWVSLVIGLMWPVALAWWLLA